MVAKSGEDERAEALAAIEAHYAALTVGTRATQDAVFDEEAVRAYAARHGVEYPGRHIDANGALLVPPGMVFMRPAGTFGVQDGPRLARGGIFTETDRRYARPVRVGEPIRFEGELTERYERRGYYYVVVDWRAVDAEGAELAAGREWHTIGMVRKPVAS